METRVLQHVDGEGLVAQLGRGQRFVDAVEALARFGDQHGAHTALGRKARGQTFHRAAQFDRVMDVGFGKILHRIPARGQRVEQPFFGELHECQPHWRARDFQPLDQPQLGDARPGLQLAAEDQLAQRELGLDGLRGGWRRFVLHPVRSRVFNCRHHATDRSGITRGPGLASAAIILSISRRIHIEPASMLRL